MTLADVNLSSVNWEHGMLLTPDHFLRQERYTDSVLLWMLRFAASNYGLIGGGPRLDESERGAVRHDPAMVVHDEGESLSISVTQCRGLTPAGCVIEVEPEYALQCRVSKADLTGTGTILIYVTSQPHEKLVVDGQVDEYNPQMKTERRMAYRVQLEPEAASIPLSIAIGRLRRQQQGSRFEKDPSFIPACSTMSAFSELFAAWRSISEGVAQLANRLYDLHRAMRDFLVLFAERDIDTAADAEVMIFVDRMVAIVTDCQYRILDPTQSPQSFFNALRQLFRTAAIYLELTPAVQAYFDTLKQTGETEFISPLERQKRELRDLAKWDLNADLSVEVRATTQSLDSLLRLERALEGKYVDFRHSSSLEAMNFIFDRGGQVLYKLAARPARTQGVANELTIYFSQLRLEGREKYRLILVGESQAIFEVGEKIAVDIRINEGSGFRRQPIIGSSETRSRDQRNFEVDFEAPDVSAITDLRVSFRADLPIRSALLFTRHRFFAGRTAATRDAEIVRSPAEPAIAPQMPDLSANRIPPRDAPRDRVAETSNATPAAPWDPPQTPPRRRRLE